MKIGLDKQVITISEIKEAKEFAAENTWMDVSTVENAASRNVAAFFNREDYYFAVELIGTPVLTVSKNHYHFTIWCECWAKFTYEGKRHIAEISMDLSAAAIDGKAESFIILYDEYANKTVEQSFT